MLKNWLIRTKSNHILGPISKAKTCELYKNGSIKPDDELCSGNGYWFFVKESDLIQRYLLGDEIQTYNPICEANDVISANAPSTSGSSHGSVPVAAHKDDHHSDEVKMPAEDDLAFPDMGDTPVPPPPKNEVHAPAPPPSTNQAEVHEIPTRAPVNNIHIEPPKRREIGKPKKEATAEIITPRKTSDHKKLYTLAIVVLLLAIAFLLYRKYTSKPVPISELLNPISVAYADEKEVKKKK